MTCNYPSSIKHPFPPLGELSLNNTSCEVIQINNDNGLSSAISDFIHMARFWANKPKFPKLLPSPPFFHQCSFINRSPISLELYSAMMRYFISNWAPTTPRTVGCAEGCDHRRAAGSPHRPLGKSASRQSARKHHLFHFQFICKQLTITQNLFSHSWNAPARRCTCVPSLAARTSRRG